MIGDSDVGSGKRGGRRYQEMHVDGGAMAQVFVYPVGLDFEADLPDSATRRPRL